MSPCCHPSSSTLLQGTPWCFTFTKSYSSVWLKSLKMKWNTVKLKHGSAIWSSESVAGNKIIWHKVDIDGNVPYRQNYFYLAHKSTKISLTYFNSHCTVLDILIFSVNLTVYPAWISYRRLQIYQKVKCT